MTVYDRDDPGSGPEDHLVLTPNGTRVLRALHVGALLSGACKPDAHAQRSWRGGFVLAQRPLGAFIEARYGAPEVIVTRRAVLQALLTQCTRYGVAVHANQECLGVEQDTDRVTLTFETETICHDVVIGCDGEASAARSNMGDVPVTPTTHDVAWAGSCQGPELPAGLMANAITTWLGPGAYLTHWPSPGGNGVGFLAFARGRETEAKLESTFRSWHDDVAHLVRAATDVYPWRAVEYEPLTRWYDRRIALLGDACHPVTPHLQQGASLAMEDAWVLARMLERWEDEPAKGFADYERYRKVRLRRFSQGQRRHLAELTVDAAGEAWRRNLRLSLTSRFLPEIAMQRLDWLYGYDCIKGFE